MALLHWEKKAAEISVEERRRYTDAEFEKANRTANEIGMFFVMVVWISGLDKAEIQKHLAFFDYLDDARDQAERWNIHFKDYVFSVYTNFD